MNRLIFFILAISTLTSFGKSTEERILYVVDSIAIIEDPEEEEGNLQKTDIETLTVVTNKAEIEKHGYTDIDKIFFIITKEYAKRPDDIRKIPTTKKMERKGGKWHAKGSTTP